MYNFILHWGMAGPLIMIAGGMVALLIGGESLIRGASRLAVAMRIPPLIVGLTIVAFCTSAPELAVSLSAALKGNADMAVGNVVGSNICNICFILGLSALLKPIRVESTLIRREIPMMIVLSLFVYIFAVSGGTVGGGGTISSLLDGTFQGRVLPWEGGLFLAVLLGYIGWTVYEVLYHKPQNEVIARELEEEVLPDAAHPEVKTAGTLNIVSNLCLVLVGVGLLVAGSDMMVQGSVRIAQLFGVSELVIGLTILAVGTSLPELIVSILAAAQGKSDIAVGNVIGSNVFNILGVLGPTALVTGFTERAGLDVTARAMQVDIPFMIVISLFCLVICVTGRRVSRAEGVFLLLCYAGYLAFLCLFGGA